MGVVEERFVGLMRFEISARVRAANPEGIAIPSYS